MKSSFSQKIIIYFSIFTIIMLSLNTAVYLSVMQIWFFINKTINNITGTNINWAIIILALIAATLIYSVIVLLSYLKKKSNGDAHIKIVNIIVPIIFAIIFSVLEGFIYKMLENSRDIIIRNIVSKLPWLLLITIAIFLLVFYQDFKLKRKVRYVAASLMVLVIILYIIGAGKVKITSGPCVQYISDDEIEVIWTTNKKSTGYVEYGTDKNNLKKVYAFTDGIEDANTTVHKVDIPITKGSKFMYRVGSTKINWYFENNVEYGNTVASDFRNYKDGRNKNTVTFYVLCDVHENENVYKKFLKNGDYDFIVLNGDMINSVDSENVIIDKILKPLSYYTDGVKPFYCVRGNHETRGAALRKLPEYLALPGGKYYYSFSYGPVFSVVLDSGEDKEDSNKEYSGLNNFEDYRLQETKWLDTLKESNICNDASCKIAFIHIPFNFYDGLHENSQFKSYQQEWQNQLKDIGISAVFSGHTHEAKIVKPYGTDLPYPIFIGGGEAYDIKSFVAIKVEASEDGMKVQYIRYDGSILSEYEVKNK